MNAQPNLSATAFLIADAARAAMLMSLADGRALPAGELAHAAGVTPQTASSHLAKLLHGGLVCVEKQGRHRYYKIASPQVAVALESLASIAPQRPSRRNALGRNAESLRFARCCYDHLAGKAGVAITQKLMTKGFLSIAGDKRLDVTPTGAAWFATLGINISDMKRGRHGIAHQCMDWTEREHHLAGPLGVGLLDLLCEKGWFRRSRRSPSVEVTPVGWTGLWEQLGLTLGDIERSQEDGAYPDASVRRLPVRHPKEANDDTSSR
ncbi:winged helix-turn-helix domain-containing protein [Paraburkholderia sprentiae WSM5005]|uniref:Winged helix-turn-helix domain-containing protein n=1 Tax=Paraburkholderia sprentiae WSM5005 TaxID=754502 RepID=A0A8F4KIH4_9BURK|nr:winged helix-turn-helix domain-containing protein [Paraburkholderia sprentiae]QXE07288.1 winged helix-turn-helix domain-containing protein [Paraburkholderia sprentiae WSM5005]